MKNKTGIISLIIGSGLWCLIDLYWLFKGLISGNEIMNRTFLELLFSIINSIIPLSILVFAIASTTQKEEEESVINYTESENNSN